MTKPFVTAAGACAAALVSPLTAQRILETARDGQPAAYFGSALAPAGDVDRDGVPDWVTGAPRRDHGGLDDRGLVVVISGRSGSWIHPRREALLSSWAIEPNDEPRTIRWSSGTGPTRRPSPGRGAASK